MALRVNFFLISLLTLITFFVISPASVSFSSSATDDQIKAAMIIKFTDFIEWPKKALDREYFIIAISGDEKIFSILSKLNSKPIKDKKLQVIRIKDGEYPENINILYISKNEFHNWNKIKNKINNEYLLTISDKNSFLKHGGIIQFIKKRSGNIGFGVNRITQLKSKLKFSSYLLRLAKIVDYHGESYDD